MLDNEVLSKTIGRRLKELRESAGYSMEEECENLNRSFGLKIGKGMMSRWETGKSQPTNIFLCAYALYHNIDLNYLVGLSDFKAPLNSKLSSQENELLNSFQSLNNAGKQQLLNTAADMIAGGRYAPASEKKDVTTSSV